MFWAFVFSLALHLLAILLLSKAILIADKNLWGSPFGLKKNIVDVYLIDKIPLKIDTAEISNGRILYKNFDSASDQKSPNQSEEATLKSKPQESVSGIDFSKSVGVPVPLDHQVSAQGRSQSAFLGGSLPIGDIHEQMSRSYEFQMRRSQAQNYALFTTEYLQRNFPATQNISCNISFEGINCNTSNQELKSFLSSRYSEIKMMYPPLSEIIFSSNENGYWTAVIKD